MLNSQHATSYFGDCISFLIIPICFIILIQTELLSVQLHFLIVLLQINKKTKFDCEEVPYVLQTVKTCLNKVLLNSSHRHIILLIHQTPVPLTKMNHPAWLIGILLIIIIIISWNYKSYPGRVKIILPESKYGVASCPDQIGPDYFAQRSFSDMRATAKLKRPASVSQRRHMIIKIRHHSGDVHSDQLFLFKKLSWSRKHYINGSPEYNT